MHDRLECGVTVMEPQLELLRGKQLAKLGRTVVTPTNTSEHTVDAAASSADTSSTDTTETSPASMLKPIDGLTGMQLEVLSTWAIPTTTATGAT